jgi:hypothetical protein
LPAPALCFDPVSHLHAEQAALAHESERLRAEALRLRAKDEHQAPASRRSAPASLLHPSKNSVDAITAPFHARHGSRLAADRLSLLAQAMLGRSGL